MSSPSAVAVREQLLVDVGAEDRDAVHLPLVVPVQLPAVLEVERADVLIAAARCRAPAAPPALKRLFTLRPPRCSLRRGHRARAAPAPAWHARIVSRQRRCAGRRARRRPAVLVRPPQTIPMFLPELRSTCSLPWRKPSPVADRMTTEITPHRIPNIVRKLRSLCARGSGTSGRALLACVGPGAKPGWTVPGAMASADVAPDAADRQLGRTILSPCFSPLDDLRLRAVADAGLDRHLALAALRARVEQVDRRVALRVVADGGSRG